MEVTKHNFTGLLPRMLKDIGDCSFVALDFEFSGIFNQKLRPASSYSDGEVCLQKRYEEVKQAAEEYQILQVGITLIIEDGENGSYLLRPYNIPLSPILDPGLNVERKWSFQSSAVAFLMSHGFQIESVFTDGVPYISLKEEKDAEYRARQGNPEVAPINLETLGKDQAEFIKQVRQDIEKWIKIDKLKDGYLNIPGPSAKTDINRLSLELDNYQKRLVHQIVGSEYPDYVSFGKKTFVQIIPYDKARETKITEKKLLKVRKNIANQKGLGWVVEALTRGKVSGLDLRLLWRPDGMFTAAEGKKLANQSEAIKAKLESGHPILVGHNMFTDLVNFYKCFIGELPERVEEFQQATHELFPRVVDTKYMATQKGGLRDAFSSLEALNATLDPRELPRFAIDSEHSGYKDRSPAHEAGYDSLITAQVFLKLAGQLYETSSSRQSLRERTNREATETEQTNFFEADDVEMRQEKFVYGHTTRFELLAAMDEEEENGGNVGSSEDNGSVDQKILEGELLPRFEDDFWSVYTNKLRVFGTAEGICDLAACTAESQELEPPN